MAPMDRITIEPDQRSGKPCIRGLRMTVSDVLGYLASGMSEDEILHGFPDLEREDIRACLAFAAGEERTGAQTDSQAVVHSDPAIPVARLYFVVRGCRHGRCSTTWRAASPSKSSSPSSRR